MKAKFPPARILSLTIFSDCDGAEAGNGKPGVNSDGWLPRRVHLSAFILPDAPLSPPPHVGTRGRRRSKTLDHWNDERAPLNAPNAGGVGTTALVTESLPNRPTWLTRYRLHVKSVTFDGCIL